MNRDTDLFVQAFWVKCRETIRPELDFTVDDLKSEGHDAHVATQEYSDVPDRLPEAGPSVILTVHPKGAAEGHALRFQGDVTRNSPCGVPLWPVIWLSSDSISPTMRWAAA